MQDKIDGRYAEDTAGSGTVFGFSKASRDFLNIGKYGLWIEAQYV